LAELAASGGATVVIDPTVRGNVVLKLNQVRWDQAFDIVVRVNGLDWIREGDSLKVFPRKRSVSRLSTSRRNNSAPKAWFGVETATRSCIASRLEKRDMWSMSASCEARSQRKRATQPT
jgi:hypothetical protein